MRVVALEEHFAVPSAAKRISPEALAKRGFRPRTIAPGTVSPLDLLPERPPTVARIGREARMLEAILGELAAEPPAA